MSENRRRDDVGKCEDEGTMVSSCFPQICRVARLGSPRKDRELLDTLPRLLKERETGPENGKGLERHSDRKIEPPEVLVATVLTVCIFFK